MSSSAYLFQFNGSFNDHDWQRLWKSKAEKNASSLPGIIKYGGHLPSVPCHTRDGLAYAHLLPLFLAGLDRVRLHGGISAPTTTKQLQKAPAMVGVHDRAASCSNRQPNLTSGLSTSPGIYERNDDAAKSLTTRRSTRSSSSY